MLAIYCMYMVFQCAHLFVSCGIMLRFRDGRFGAICILIQGQLREPYISIHNHQTEHRPCLLVYLKCDRSHSKGFSKFVAFRTHHLSVRLGLCGSTMNKHLPAIHGWGVLISGDNRSHQSLRMNTCSKSHNNHIRIISANIPIAPDKRLVPLVCALCCEPGCKYRCYCAPCDQDSDSDFWWYICANTIGFMSAENLRYYHMWAVQLTLILCPSSRLSFRYKRQVSLKRSTPLEYIFARYDTLVFGGVVDRVAPCLYVPRACMYA